MEDTAGLFAMAVVVLSWEALPKHHNLRQHLARLPHQRRMLLLRHTDAG